MARMACELMMMFLPLVTRIKLCALLIKFLLAVASIHQEASNAETRQKTWYDVKDQ